MIKIRKVNEVHVIIGADPGYLQEIKELFTFTMEDYIYDWKYKAYGWNGKVSLFDIKTGLLPIGHVPALVKYLRAQKYDYDVDKSDFYGESVENFDKFIEDLLLPFPPRPEQLRYIKAAIKNSRLVIVSPTGSGKSLILYILWKWYGVRTLLIVPTLSLVQQMGKDFISYGADPNDIALISAYADKDSTKLLQIANYQAIYNQNPAWFDNFKMVLADECHQYEAITLQKIMLNATFSTLRFGTTGTMPGDKLKVKTIEGMFGPSVQFTTTAKLIEKGDLARCDVTVVVLRHEHAPNMWFDAHINYKRELKYILNNPRRAQLIAKLAMTLKGNTLIAFREIDAGWRIYNEIEGNGHEVWFLDGSVDVHDREIIRDKLENNSNQICVCSTIFQTGVNVKNIDNIILSHPTKSNIRLLQTIGRGLRTKDGKYKLKIYDFADDLMGPQDNHTMKHLAERVRIYDRELFPVKVVFKVV